MQDEDKQKGVEAEDIRACLVVYVVLDLDLRVGAEAVEELTL